MPPKLYFGHPINTYGTEFERRLLDAIAVAFPDGEIMNPNADEHDKGYRSWKERTGKGMRYFYEEVLPSCGGGIFLPFRDGSWAAGVYGEAKWFADRDLPVYVLDRNGTCTPVDLSTVRVLSVDETRSRIRYPDGSSRIY